MELKLMTAESGYGPGDNCSAIEGITRRHWTGTLPTEIDPAVTAHAIVRQSRWVVLCPWCPSAALASTEDHRFFCVSCGSAPVGGKWINVEWPDYLEQIEASLALRADPTTRNWELGERVGNLAIENAEHGESGLVLST